MKKQLLFVALSTLMGGGSVALADTSLLTTADGWTKITSISQSDIADNYYVFVDNDADLMLGLASSTNQTYNAMFYQTSVSDLTKDLAKVWMLEVNGENYGLRNLSLNAYQLQTEWDTDNKSLYWRTNDQDASIEWTGLGLSYADGAWSLTPTKNSRPLGIYNNGTDSPAEGNELGANDAGKGQKFQIYSIPKATFNAKLLAGASAESAVDATALIYNPTFDYKNNNGRIGCWSGTVTYQTKNSSGGNYNYGNGAIEMWHLPSFDLNQTLTNLPNGKYQVSVQVVQSGTYTAELYATSNGTTKTMTANTATDGNFAANAQALAADRTKGKITVETVVVDGKMTIGLRDASSSSSWIVFDNFTMSYLGTVDLSEYVTAYETALTAAKAVNQESPMNGDVLKALTTALSTYGTVDKTSQDALVAATGALNTATANATTSIASYAKANTVLENTLKFINSTNFYTAEALTTYKTSDYTTPKGKYDARTLTDAEAAALQDPYALGSWKVERNVWALLRSTWSDTSLNINTWSTEGDTDGSNFVRPFVEWWVVDSSTLPAGTKTGTLGGLTAGKVYEVSANVRVRQSNSQTEVKGVTMDVNGGASVNVCDGDQIGSSQLYLKKETKTYGLVGEDGNLNVNFTAADGNTISWLAFKDVKYTATEIAVLDEDGDNSSVAAAENTNIGVKRSFTAYTWNSVVLPFDMTYSQVQALFGSGTKTAEYTGATANTEDNTITLNFSTKEGNNVAIKANTPCLVRPAKSVTFAVAEGVNVVAPTSSSLAVTDDLVNFVGTYSKGGLAVTDKDYFVSTDNKLYQAKGGETIKAFRAIFRLNDATQSDAKIMMSFGGTDGTTFIQSVGKTNTEKYNVYNLAGQVVKRNATSLDGLQKGLYIVNGKKVVVD